MISSKRGFQMIYKEWIMGERKIRNSGQKARLRVQVQNNEGF